MCIAGEDIWHLDCERYKAAAGIRTGKRRRIQRESFKGVIGHYFFIFLFLDSDASSEDSQSRSRTHSITTPSPTGACMSINITLIYIHVHIVSDLDFIDCS